jgi:hypothetical protein
MKRSRLSALCLASVWFAACATAENSASPGSSDGGSNGSTNGGAHTGGSSNGAFGGSTGIPGSSGSTGSPGAGVGGSGASTSGAGGLASGAGGTAGTAGTGGAGGSGGGAPVFESGVCAENPTMSLSYHQNSTELRKIAAEYQFINTSATPIPVAALKIRYFFSNEETAAWVPHVYTSQIDGGTGNYRPMLTETTLSVVKLGTKLEGADTYAELSYSGSETLEQGAIAKAQWELDPDYMPPDQVQSDDYSYNAADTTFTVWDHIAIYQGDTLVFGCVPKSPGDGAAGAGGDTGAGGAETGGGAGPAGTGGAAGTAGGGTAGTSTGGNAGTSGSASAGSAGLGGTAGSGGSAGSSTAGTAGSL